MLRPEKINSAGSLFAWLTAWLSDRRSRREFARQKQLEAAGDFRLAALAKANEDLRERLRLAEEALAAQLAINHSERERIAWEAEHCRREPTTGQRADGK